MLTGIITLVVLVVLASLVMPGFREATWAQLFKVGEAARNADPTAVLNSRIATARAAVGDKADAIADAAGYMHGIEREFEKAKGEVEILNMRMATAEKAGREEDALRHAGELDAAEKCLNALADQLRVAHARYDTAMQSVKIDMTNIKSAEARAKQLGVELRTSEADKRVAEKLNKAFGGSGMSLTGSLEETETIIHEKIEANRGKLDVLGELSGEKERIAEDNAVASMSAAARLAKFRAEREAQTPVVTPVGA